MSYFMSYVSFLSISFGRIVLLLITLCGANISSAQAQHKLSDVIVGYEGECSDSVLYKSYLERQRAAISNAVAEIDAESQFTFYDISLLEHEKYILSQLRLNKDNTVVINLTKSVNLQDELYVKIIYGLDIHNNADHLITLIGRLVNNILAVTGCTNAEIMIRTEEAYQVDNSDVNARCIHWHIDKSLAEIFNNTQDDASCNRAKEKLFIIPLVGEPTLFYLASEQQKKDFLNLANETKFVYGYNSSQNCLLNYGIDRLLGQDNIVHAGNGYGSVHVTGRHGTIHATPIESSRGRLLLFVTPLE